MTTYYPLVGFHFQVNFLGLPDKGNDIKFQSVSGLNVSFETTTLKEGGENRFEHVIPLKTKYSDLVLKRGIIPPGSSAVTDWLLKAMHYEEIKPIDLQVILLGERHSPLMTWNVKHAWPKSWKVGDMNAERGEVLIDTIELTYNYFTVD